MDSIQRSHTPKDIRFTHIVNSVIEDERLTDGALEVLVYLLSKPEGWTIREKDLQRRFGYGKEKQQAIFRRLEEARYLVRERVNAAGGRIVWQRTVYDLPQDPKFDPYGQHKSDPDPFSGV